MSGSVPSWDPDQYHRFREDRARPFHDLIARVPGGSTVRGVADLGCGTGELTRALGARWPGAEVWGVDSSPAMLGRAGEGDERLHFVLADLRSWNPPHPLDRIVSNAALHWVPDHRELLARLRDRLASGGWLAVQMPNNREEPAYRILLGMLGESPWSERVPGDAVTPAIEAPAWYARTLEALELVPDVWETTYYHRLSGPEDVVEWMKGSILRPVLAGLANSGQEFLTEFGLRIEPAYPPDPWGILFPFRRLFFTARRP